MRIPTRSVSRRAVLAAAALGVSLLVVVVPLRGQQQPPPVPQTLPTVTFAVPATAAQGRWTRVEVSFTLPEGVRLLRNPRVKVIDAQEKLVALLPIFYSQVGPASTGYRDLNTGSYRPGAYRVFVELEYLLPTGQRGTVAAPVAPLTVPQR